MKKLSIQSIRKVIKEKDFKKLIHEAKIIFHDDGFVEIKACDLIALGNYYLEHHAWSQAIDLYNLSIQSEPEVKDGYYHLMAEYVKYQKYGQCFTLITEMDARCQDTYDDNSYFLYLLNFLMDLPAYYQTRVASINENDLIKPRLGKKNFFRLMAFRGQFAIARLGYLAQKKANDIEDKLNYRLLDKVLEIQELRRKIKNLIVWEDYAEIIKVLEKTHSLPKDLKYVLILAKKTLSLENTLALPTVCEKECSDVYAAIEQNNWPLALELCQNDLLKPLLVNINNFINELNWNSNDVALDLKNQDFAIDYIFSMCGIANIEEVISYVNQNGLAAAQQHFNFDAAQQQIIIACLAYYAYKEKLNNLGDNYLKMLKHKETKNNKVKAIVSYIEKNKKLFRNCHDTSRTLKKE